MHFTLEEIAAATRAPLDRVTAHWPLISDALSLRGADTKRILAAAAATVAVETGPRKRRDGADDPLYFTPRVERGSREYFDRYIGKLGNVTSDDAYDYRGRGFPQLTGLTNYRHQGDRLNLPLLTQPDLACDPAVSARIFALFFVESGAAREADRGNWAAARRRVNGGLNGWADFSGVLRRLLPDEMIA